jgi:hypothetical protein
MSISDKYTAFAKAMTDMQVLDIGLWQTLDADQRNWTGTYTATMKGDVARARANGFPKQAAAIEAFWSDPGAWNYEKKLAIAAGNAVGKTLSGISNSAAAVGQAGQNIAGDVGSGLASAFDVSSLVSAIVNKNTWLRIGEGVIGIILLGIGVSIVAKSTSVGKSATKVAATAAKVVK